MPCPAGGSVKTGFGMGIGLLCAVERQRAGNRDLPIARGRAAARQFALRRHIAPAISGTSAVTTQNPLLSRSGRFVSGYARQLTPLP